MELFSDDLNEMEAFTGLRRLAWGLSEVSDCTVYPYLFFAPKCEPVAFQFADSDAECWSGMRI